MQSLSPMLNCAFKAATRGTEILMEGFGRNFEIKHKGLTDLVTEFDLKSEIAIRDILSHSFPDHQIIGEENGLSGARSSPYQWFIDPLDGTTNFAHGHPFFCVSIGLWGPDEKGVERPLLGVINAPVLGEIFWATHKNGAFRRQYFHGRGFVEKKLQVSSITDLRQATINTGFPYDVMERGKSILGPFGRVVVAAQAIRRAGAAALDLAYVAAGVADGFWENGLKGWDSAAGLVLINEAGGQTSDYEGGLYRPGHSQTLIATNGHLHQSLKALICETPGV